MRGVWWRLTGRRKPAQKLLMPCDGVLSRATLPWRVLAQLLTKFATVYKTPTIMPGLSEALVSASAAEVIRCTLYLCGYSNNSFNWTFLRAIRATANPPFEDGCEQLMTLLTFYLVLRI